MGEDFVKNDEPPTGMPLDDPFVIERRERGWSMGDLGRYIQNGPVREWQLAQQARIEDAARGAVIDDGMNDMEVMEVQLAEIEQLQFPASMDLLHDK